MHFSQYLLTLSAISSIISAAPFIPQNGELQKHRRRWIDYPLLAGEALLPINGPRKRSIRERYVPYSVVPVNGEPTTVGDIFTTTVQVSPSVQTVFSTQPAMTFTLAQPAETIAYTSVVTTTKPVTAAAAQTTPSPQVETEVIVRTQGVTTTVTPSQSSTSTEYYDDGLWHTSYAVKSWASRYVPTSSLTPAPYPTAATTFDVRGQGTGIPGAASPSGAYGLYPRIKRHDVDRAVVNIAPNRKLSRTDYDALRRFIN